MFDAVHTAIQVRQFVSEGSISTVREVNSRLYAQVLTEIPYLPTMDVISTLPVLVEDPDLF